MLRIKKKYIENHYLHCPLKYSQYHLVHSKIDGAELYSNEKPFNCHAMYAATERNVHSSIQIEQFSMKHQMRLFLQTLNSFTFLLFVIE